MATVRPVLRRPQHTLPPWRERVAVAAMAVLIIFAIAAACVSFMQ